MPFTDVVRRSVSALASAPGARTALLTARRRGALPWSIGRRLPADDPVFVDDPAIGVPFHFTGPEDFRRAIQWQHPIDEVESLAVWARLTRDADLVLDVGANLGQYAVIAGVQGARVLAFEPVANIAGMLTSNVVLNGLAERCTVVVAAVAEQAGTADLHVPGGAGSMTTMASLDAGGFRGKVGEVITVDVVTADEASAGLGRVGAVKIDVEGFEDAVLRGMTRILTEDRPAIIAECLPDGPFAAVEAILREHDYRFYALTASGPEARDAIRPEPHEQERNYLALPAERAGLDLFR